LKNVEKIIALKADPSLLLRQFRSYAPAIKTAIHALPRKKAGRMPVLYGETEIDKLPQVVSWPDDGGSFITLPQVLSMPPGGHNILESNLGMYRIQMSGNDYLVNEEVGMHYQLHRGIGVHHKMYNDSETEFRVSIFIGGLPSHAFAAIMPMPEGISELTFAGMLAGRRFRYGWHQGDIISGDADFCITGTIQRGVKKPEGPFGDHLGYYSLAHDFPVMKIDKVYHRKDPIWHFTVVGRPPQEDSSFGHLIHQLVEPLTPKEFPGLEELNAVDAAGVHPLLLAIGSERYMPFRERKPEEILTIANHLLGKGQTSLAKYLFIAAAGDAPDLNTKKIDHFFQHILERIDLRRDLHFHTNTTIDTLDYSGSGWNAGSKLVIACCGKKKRTLAQKIPGINWPKSMKNPKLIMPGILAVEMNPFKDYPTAKMEIGECTKHLEQLRLDDLPLIIITDDSQFTAETLNNFVWVTFTRSNPSHDVYGSGSKITYKHWGCTGPLIIDARMKPFHAPELIQDPAISKKVDTLFQKGGQLEKWSQ
jgi:4-hydroxy-3-polyprenylbenzoate decarboxylase